MKALFKKYITEYNNAVTNNKNQPEFASRFGAKAKAIMRV